MASPRRRRARTAPAAPRVIAYLRVSTEQQAESGAGLDAQRTTIEAHCQINGWTDVEYVTDPAWSAKDLNRPKLTAALDRLAAGEADVLIASKLDRISRSVHDFSGLLARAEREGWRLVLLDIGVDTSTPVGELVATTIAGTAQYERRIIGQRTREGLAAKRAAGVRLGRPSVLDDGVVRRILADRAAGLSMRAVAAGLTADGVPTARGGTAWSSSTVQAVLNGQDAARIAAEVRA